MTEAGKGTEKAMEEIREALIRTHNDLSSFRTAVANKHVVVFLGNTRSGKSTLVNFVMGTKLTAFEERRPIFKIRKVDENDFGPTIGQGVQSCTSVPGVYPLNQLGMVIIDAPGFDDNRGEAQDIVNALYINQIKFVKTVKFVLVSDLNELTSDNIKGFTDLIAKTHTLLPNLENVKQSVSIVFTKDYREHTQEDITTMLQKKILNVEELYINKELIEHFASNPDFIGIFRMPSCSGEVTKSIDINIENARVLCCATVLDESSVQVAFSAKSRLALMKIYQQYLDSMYFEQQLKELLTVFAAYFDVDDYVYASLNDELNDVKQNLVRILTLVETELNINRNMQHLCEIKTSMMRIFSGRRLSQDFSKSFSVLTMIDDALLMEDAIKARFVGKYKESLKEVVKKMKWLASKIDDELKDRENTRRLFNASAGIARGAGGATVVGEVLHRVFSEGSRTGSLFGIVGIIGGLVTSVGAGIAATSYVSHKETQKKRMKARMMQGRLVHDGMFDDE